jgi:tungstate transport system substrate-binding protein
LLDVLLPVFEFKSGYQVKPISVGTGAALELGARGEADVVLVHAPEAEREWMEAGNGTERLLVMHNDFVIVGPADDPAGIQGATSAVSALAQIGENGAKWVSRDDDSGTNQLERRLWEAAGIEPSGEGWYSASGQGMGATLTLADQTLAYTISDRGTYLARSDTLESVVLVEGDTMLLNLYHVMPVNPEKFPNVTINREGAEAFAAFMVSDEAQVLIRDFGVAQYGQALFVPDAGKNEAELLAQPVAP